MCLFYFLCCIICRVRVLSCVLCILIYLYSLSCILFFMVCFCYFSFSCSFFFFVFLFFFFKQKTAYEMRISDWSSDVCSSDLRNDGAVWGSAADPVRNRIARPPDDRTPQAPLLRPPQGPPPARDAPVAARHAVAGAGDAGGRGADRSDGALPLRAGRDLARRAARDLRSEAPTSELQSPMRHP